MFPLLLKKYIWTTGSCNDSKLCDKNVFFVPFVFFVVIFK